ncbi:hypothetical protein GCM10017557_79160 [Streptomyces aurantiacus]|uniref:Uncharacterized protein n=1 Tax=Streptomyces aurantiacus TaxID=47760 RepID=A0A7G1PGL8_9ACTN|nr:hypothetical protein GCM10017557_79160 [Streptomyces aurantiacus]
MRGSVRETYRGIADHAGRGCGEDGVPTGSRAREAVDTPQERAPAAVCAASPVCQARAFSASTTASAMGALEAGFWPVTRLSSRMVNAW